MTVTAVSVSKVMSAVQLSTVALFVTHKRSNSIRVSGLSLCFLGCLLGLCVYTSVFSCVSWTFCSHTLF